MANSGDPDVSVVLNLCEQLKETADIYYILGNHEGVLIYQEGGLEVPLDGYLYDMGVTVCYPGEYVIQPEFATCSEKNGAYAAPFF